MNALIEQARTQYGEILPCSGKASLEECITDDPRTGRMLWFNSADGDTHVVSERELA
ncbi:MAG: hypothetical protein IMZ50_11005 [Candidatus Atribacteria bacterium]|nr:hypothetical protein [Candidatus Atribacteria bacterium]